MSDTSACAALDQCGTALLEQVRIGLISGNVGGPMRAKYTAEPMRLGSTGVGSLEILLYNRASRRIGESNERELRLLGSCERILVRRMNFEMFACQPLSGTIYLLRGLRVTCHELSRCSFIPLWTLFASLRHQNHPLLLLIVLVNTKAPQVLL